jgi:hypothetical protein
MRLLTLTAAIAFIALCLLPQNAQAQGMGGMGGRGKHQGDAPPKDDKAPKADDKAYKDALKRIPEKKVDPWGAMR